MYANYRTYVTSRILSRSVKRENGCIEYAGDQKLQHKYGLVSITTDTERKNVPAHRAMWMATNNVFDLPHNVFIRHKCDNPRCVNIKHLVAGTPKQNTQDCIERGRRAKKYKPHTRQRKLTDEQVIDVRDGKEKPSYYCLKYNITSGYVSKLKHRKAKALV